jgi:hypothetical protein
VAALRMLTPSIGSRDPLRTTVPCTLILRASAGAVVAIAASSVAAAAIVVRIFFTISVVYSVNILFKHIGKR